MFVKKLFNFLKGMANAVQSTSFAFIKPRLFYGWFIFIWINVFSWTYSLEINEHFNVKLIHSLNVKFFRRISSICWMIILHEITFTCVVIALCQLFFYLITVTTKPWMMAKQSIWKHYTMLWTHLQNIPQILQGIFRQTDPCWAHICHYPATDVQPRLSCHKNLIASCSGTSRCRVDKVRERYPRHICELLRVSGTQHRWRKCNRPRIFWILRFDKAHPVCNILNEDN